MKDFKKYLKLFACCIPVGGYRRSAIYDFQRHELKLIPNALYKLLPLFDSLDEELLISYYGIHNRNTIIEYIKFLLENHVVFYCHKDELNNFPSIDVSEFHFPSFITNAIVELEQVDKDYLLLLIQELNSVGCVALEVRFCKSMSLEKFRDFLYLFNTSNINITELTVITPESNWNLIDIKHLFEVNLRLSTLIFSNSTKDEVHNDFFVTKSQIIYSTRSLHLPTCCGNFNPQNLIFELPFIIESQHYNTCLNKKIAIDKYGGIKNCPSMAQIFGNVKDIKLINVINNEKFIVKWNISKDKIKVCQDCEFRHVCMDCRAYLEEPDNDYSKPLKCGYNPYTMEWDDWFADNNKKKAIEFYKLKEIEI